MDANLFKNLYQHEVIKPNERVIKGIADEQFLHAVEKIKERFLSNARHWPEGLDFIDIRLATPERVAEHMVRGNNKDIAKYELKRNRAFMIEVILAVYGEEKIKPIWIPYPKNNILLLNDVEYMLSMVMSDDLFSVDTKDNGRVFLKTDLDSISFNRRAHRYYIDETLVNQTVFYTPLYKNKKAKNERSRKERREHIECDPTLIHYLCAREDSGGLTGVIKKYVGCDIHFGTSETINYLEYPAEKYCIAYSSGVKPSATKNSSVKAWEPNRLRIAYPRENDDQFMRNILAGVFYITDHYPHRLTHEELDNQFTWMMVMSFLYFPWQLSTHERCIQMEQHLKNVFLYLDDDIARELNKDRRYDIPVDDFYDVLALMLKFTNQIIDDAEIGSMFNKTIKTVEFLLSDFFNKIGSVTLSFQKPAKNAMHQASFSKETIIRTIGGALHRDVALRELQRNIGVKHKEVRQLNTATPCLAVKTTTAMVMQEEVKAGNNSNVDICKKESYFAHESIIVIGSLMRQPKYRPDSRAMMNTSVIIDDNYRVHPHPATSWLIKRCRADLATIPYRDDYTDYDLAPLNEEEDS